MIIDGNRDLVGLQHTGITSTKLWKNSVIRRTETLWSPAILAVAEKIALNKACRIGNLDSVSKKRVGPGTARGLKVYEVLKYVLLEQDNRLEHHLKLTSKLLKVDKMRHILRKLSIGHYSFAFEGFEYRAQISRGRLGVEVICKLTV